MIERQASDEHVFVAGGGVTDGERLVWSSAFALALSQHDDAIIAARAAARAVEALREALVRRRPDGNFVIWEGDDRLFLDEIVSVP
jgi:hypothetical protein